LTKRQTGKVPTGEAVNSEVAQVSGKQAAPIAPDADDAPSADEMAAHISWWNGTLDAAQWLTHHAVQPVQAAMLLFGLNPDETDLDQAAATTNDASMTPAAFRRLCAAFDDLERARPKPRRLVDWAEVARERHLAVHPWLRNYLAYGQEVAMAWEKRAVELRSEARAVAAQAQQAVGDSQETKVQLHRLENNAAASEEAARVLRLALTPAPPAEVQATRPVQRQVAWRESILSALQAKGFDPLALPPAPRGRASPAKQAARKELSPKMSEATFKKAWQALLCEGRIAERPP